MIKTTSMRAGGKKFLKAIVVFRVYTDMQDSLTIDRKILLLALTRPKFRNLTTITAIPRNIRRTDTAIPVPAPAWELNWRSRSVRSSTTFRLGLRGSGKVRRASRAIAEAMREANPPTCIQWLKQYYGSITKA